MDYKEKYEKLKGLVNDLYPHMSDYCKEKINEYFPKPTEIRDEQIRKTLLNEFIHLQSKGYKFAGLEGEDIVAWLEKQDKHKPADKAEPKFKVGDWIVTIDDEGDVAIEMITKFWGNKVETIDTDGIRVTFPQYELNHYHLWTIQDANDGDVIFYDDGWTCIFKYIHGKWFSSYCFITAEREFFTGYEEHAVDTNVNGNANPATKEQRDLLFQKMKEAGYEWDIEKKELKKIEQNPIDSDWVDLGLPSGTLWKSSNEADPGSDDNAFYTYDEAMQKFGDQLPTKEQWEELKGNCQWIWTGNGYKAIGPNDNSIFLPAAGYRSCAQWAYEVGSYGEYWSSKPINSAGAWCFEFNPQPQRVSIVTNNRYLGQSVRLVKNVRSTED